jgi:hypothetical protein
MGLKLYDKNLGLYFTSIPFVAMLEGSIFMSWPSNLAPQQCICRALYICEYPSLKKRWDMMPNPQQLIHANLILKCIDTWC